MSKDKITEKGKQGALPSTGNAVLDFLVAQDPSASAASSRAAASAPNGAPKQDTANTLSAELSRLELLISGSSGDEENLGDEEVMELLRQMEEADGLASGIEDKLDGLLENLEGMLKGLETPQTTDEKAGKGDERGS